MNKITLPLALCLALLLAAPPASRTALSAPVMAASSISIKFYDTESVRPVTLSPMISAVATWPSRMERQTAKMMAKNRIREEFKRLPLYAKGYRIERILEDDGFPDFPSQRFHIIIR